MLRLLLAMKDELAMDIRVFPQPQFTVAFGAAMILYREKEQKKREEGLL